MGILDLPAPFFDLVDRTLLGPLPPLARLILWAIAAAIVSLTLYRWLSPQRRIVETKARVVEARRRLNAHDGDLESAMPLMRQSMGLALRQVWLVLPGALVASLPVLALLVWLDGAYGHRFPSAVESPLVVVEPAAFAGDWRPNAAGGQIAIRDGQGAKVADLALAKPVTRIEKRHWWNLIIGNPAGYLPETGPLDRVSIELPERHYLPVGPDWLRSWLAIALSALTVASILIMRLARIA